MSTSEKRTVARLKWERDKAILALLKIRRNHQSGARIAREYLMERVLDLRAVAA